MLLILLFELDISRKKPRRGSEGRIKRGSIEDAALVGGDHVLDVDEGVLASRLLEELEGFGDEVAQVEPLPLVVLDLVPDVPVGVAEDVEDGQDLPVVGHQGLADHVAAQHQLLDHLQHHRDDVGVARVQGRYVSRGVLFIGMISCGITGRILLLPLSSRSYVPMIANDRYGSSFSLHPSRNIGR